MVLAKNYGYNVFLCTAEDSYLARISSKIDIEIIPYKEHFLNRFSNFHKYFPLHKLQKKIKFDIVHCFDFRHLFALSFQLKTEDLTALVVTQDHTIDKPLQRFWYRPLISRIDSLILINKNLKNDALGNLGLPNKKIDYFGMGIKNEVVQPQAEQQINFDLYKNYFLAATNISITSDEKSNLVPLLTALKVLNEKMPGGKKSKLIFISAVEFQKIEFLPEFMKYIQENQLEEDVLFITAFEISPILQYLDLWISICSEVLIEDFAISALLGEVPVILPRNFCSKNLLEEFEGVGETYKLFDSRELKDKWEKVILGSPVFKEKTRLYKYFIEREHSSKSYKTALLSLYSRVVLRRARLFRKK